MGQVITNAFEQYWQSSLAAEQPVVLDEFVLADIPNLDITAPIDPDTVLPPEGQIVHRQTVDQRGRVNSNAVAYSIVMDTTVGDFSFNAMFLRNKANGVIGMIVYKGRETKLKTDQTTGQTGNSLVKSMLMGYDQAAEATLTHVDAGTWQIDYAARLRGQDEDLRQLASQLYGHHTFIGDGFKVVQQAGAHQVTPGVAIVGGLRVELKAPEVIYPGSKPIGVWVDVYRAGSLLSEHQNYFTIITSVADLTDHVDGSGYQHFVAKLGTVQADNTVVDGRGQGGIGGSGAIPDTFALWKRSMAEAGYDLIGRFGTKLTIQNAKQVLLSKDGAEVYAWLGALPKDVPADATLESSGGVVAGAWRQKTDFTVYNRLFSSDSGGVISSISNGESVWIASGVTELSFDTAQSEILLQKLNLVASSHPVTFHIASATVSTGNICNVGDNGNITIKGAAPIETTLASVHTVTGAVGNFSVTYNLASAAGMAVGDILCVDRILPARVHYSPAFTGVRKPVLGEMAIGFNFMGSISVSGITCSVTGGNCQTYLSVGDLVHIQGQTRLIQSVSAASFTIDAPLQFSPSGLQWWWFSKPATGTVGINGVAVTGVGTSFTTQYDVGDIMVIDGRLLRVVTIPSDTAMTITHSQTVPAGTAHSCYKAGLLHEGAFVITAIAGNQVTVTNKSRRHQPPKNLITAGRVRCIKTVLKNTGPGNGFDFSMGSELQAIADIAIVGSAAGVGLALNGSGDPTGYNQQTGQVQLTGASAVVGFNKGAFLSAGAILVANEQFFSGSTDNCIECTDGGDAYLRGARVHGSGGIGLMASGGYARASSAAFIGHSLQGIRQDVGSGVYGDTWYLWGNGAHGAMQVNACGIQLVDSISCCNGGSGINAQNGARGRLSRTLFGGNDDHGLNMTGGDHEATQIWQSGSPVGRSGVIASRGRLALEDSAQTGNGAGGLYALQMAHITADKTVQMGNVTNGVRADDCGTEITALSGYHEGNGASGITQTAGGKVAYDLNKLGTQEAGSRFREIIAITDDAVAAIFIGNQTIALEMVSSSSNTLFGAVRARVGTSASVALGWGTGITVQTGPLMGTTGVDGNFTVSPALDGYLYLENRTGSSKSIIFDIMGRIL